MKTTVDSLPQSFKSRPAKLNDAEAVAEFFNECARRAVGMDETTRDELLQRWQRPNFEIEAASQLIFNAEGQMIGFVQVSAFSPTTFGIVLQIHPDTPEVGKHLLDCAEVRIQQLLAAAPNEKILLRTQVNRAYSAVVEYLEKWGMYRKRSFLRLGMELDGEFPEPVWPEGITVRPMELGKDEETTFRVVDTAFRDHWGYPERPFEEAFPAWRALIIESRADFDPGLIFLAETAEGQVVGVAQNQLGITDMPGWAFLGQLAVLRDWRKHGLGSALMYHSFRELQKRGVPRIALGVDAENLTGAVRIYERAGMRHIMALDNYEKVLRE